MAPALSTQGGKVRIEPDREIRIAAVLYGGVSLAIYIHGVTQEFLHAVRATAPKAPGSTEPFLEELTPIEAIYRELGQRIGSRRPFAESLDPDDHDRVHTRFVVDVLSGTSAGGINGIFLAKALANHQKLDQLRTLWLREGDLALLLNDGLSFKGLPAAIKLQGRSESLLNTRRLYYRLVEAFEGLDDTSPPPPANSALVDELDLFVTTTDIRGVVLPINLWDRTVFERRYRTVFHLLYASERATGEARNDFQRRDNGFLGFAARCTSSFPLAFDPMMLGDVKRVPPWAMNDSRYEQDRERWKPFFHDYLRSPECQRDGGRTASQGIERRAYGDGGYLDNKPFSYATDQLSSRRADRRVLRKLFYVEPSPERPELDVDSALRPDAIQNLMAGESLPRAETIREDLERIIARNRVIERLGRAIEAVDDDLERNPPSRTRIEGYTNMGLQEMLARYGSAYGAYHRTKVSQLTWDIAERFGHLSGIDEESGLVAALRLLFREWRRGRYVLDREDGKLTENQLLVDYDIDYRLRRLRFLQERLDSLLGNIGRAERRAARQNDGEPDPKAAEDQARLRRLLGDDVRGWFADSRREMRAAVLALKNQIAGVEVDLRRALRRIFRPGDDQPVARAMTAARLSVEELRWVLATPLEADRQSRAATALTAALSPEARREDLVQQMMEVLANELSIVFRNTTRAIRGVLEAPASDGGIARSTIDGALRRGLTELYDRFELYDAVLYPLTWRTGAEESAPVDIVRVSPQDTTLFDEFARDGSRRFHKLAGTRFGNFGSFFKEAWRRSDLMWGRLDGAERIIRASLVPSTDAEESRVKDVVLRAHAAIVSEELKGRTEDQAFQILYQCTLRTTNGQPDQESLFRLVETLQPAVRAIDPELGHMLDPKRVSHAYRRNFDLEKSLTPEDGLPLMGRASEIFGRLLDQMSERYGPFTGKPGWWFLWLGRSIWGLVEITLPHRWGKLLMRYWISLFYLLGLLLIAGGLIWHADITRKLGLRIVLITAAVDLSLHLLGAVFRRGRRIRNLLWLLGTVVGLAGLWTLARLIPGVETSLDRWLVAAGHGIERGWAGLR